MSEFHQVVQEIQAMHDKKNKDYGTNEDPFKNINQSADWGVEPWVGAMLRANDKVKRLQKYASDGVLANEGVEDSLLDIAVYSIIALVLFRRTEKDQGQTLFDQMVPQFPGHVIGASS